MEEGKHFEKLIKVTKPLREFDKDRSSFFHQGTYSTVSASNEKFTVETGNNTTTLE